MKKLLAFSFFTTAILFVGIKPVRADYDVFGNQYSGNASVGNYIYGLDTETGARTLLTTKLFEGNSVSGTYVSGNTGELIFKTGSAGTYEAYNWNTDTWRTFEIDDASESVSGSLNLIDTHPKIIDGTIPQITTNKNNVSSNDTDITNLQSLISTSNGVVSVGANSLKLQETSGSQKMWATNSSGEIAPIDITNGTKLLINGRDVEQSINNVGALSAALTGLPTVPTDTTLACGFGTGTHGGDFAFSGGCASNVNEKLSINYAASMTMPGQEYAGEFVDNFSARAGFVWKLGKSNKPTQISMKAKEKMEVKIDYLEDKNKELENTVSTLITKLERLEKIALSETQSKDLATIKLP